MKATAIKYIDTLEYVRKAGEIKDPEVLAEYQAKTIETAFEILGSRIDNKIDNKELATKRDLDRFATKQDLGQFATKQDLVQFATKQDLVQFATKQDLRQFATKQDLRQFATKQDLGQFATSRDLDKLDAKLEKEISSVRHDIERLRYDTFKLVVRSSVAIVVTLTGIMARGFHWF